MCTGHVSVFKRSKKQDHKESLTATVKQTKKTQMRVSLEQRQSGRLRGQRCTLLLAESSHGHKTKRMKPKKLAVTIFPAWRPVVCQSRELHRNYATKDEGFAPCLQNRELGRIGSAADPHSSKKSLAR